MTADFSISCSTNEETFLPVIRVVVLGDAKVGKTALLRQYIHHESPSSSSSIGSTLLDSYTHVEYCGTQPYRLIFTDCSSSPSFREHRAAYLARCNLVILVYSVRRRKTLLNLHRWMEEVVEARGSTEPEPASTTGDFTEVPIFIVGTHYGEQGALKAANPTSTDEAESVTADCLHSVGYFIDRDDAEAEVGLQTNAAQTQKAQQHRQRRREKEKHSPLVFQNFFQKLFNINADDKGTDAATKGKATSAGVASHQHHQSASPVHSNGDLPLPTSTLLAPQLRSNIANDNTKLSGATSALSVPPGASARLPLFQLSNRDGKAVSMAVRASLSLHLWLQRQEDNIPWLSLVHTPLSSSATGLKPAVTALQVASVQASSGGLDEATGVATEKTTERLPVPPVALHACTISATSHTSHFTECSTASLMPPMAALYSVSLSGFGGGNSKSAKNPPFRESPGGSCVVQTADSSLLAVQQAPQVPNTTHPQHKKACSCSGDGGSEVAVGAENEVNTTGQKSHGKVCSPALEHPNEETGDGPPRPSLASYSPCGVREREGLMHCDGQQAPLPRTAELALSSGVGGTAAFDASMQVRKLMPMKTAVCFLPPTTHSAAAPNTVSGETNGGASNVASVPTACLPSSAHDTVDGHFWATSGPMMEDGASPVSKTPGVATRPLGDTVAGGRIAATSLLPTSGVEGAVAMKEGDMPGTECCGNRPTKGSKSVKTFPLECEPDSGLSPSPVSRHNGEDGCAVGSAVCRQPVDPLTFPVPATSDCINAPFGAMLSLRDDSVSSSRSQHANLTPTAAVTNNEPANTDPLGKPTRDREPTKLSLPPSRTTERRKHAKSLSRPLPSKRGGKARSQNAKTFKQRGTFDTSRRRHARQQEQKEKLSHCDADFCGVI
ncbi:putative ras-like small GTPases [Leishmania braziliensis MHOM/BR/75/M2904]|uniref:Ras-like small GTPases n=2 Tax=Leishmania braziliensis TaxID=5660 RepID=A4HP46_LEIBR|nr:putative ras-like small GTPases [Leishmania braziliensis MHOM/BR/75/M2904]CAJ2481346.1 unnamed protein product [Leishmania braziliensis]CAM43953.2 putative ras-like small GTPases [Leishmania braziliensis MHOM/BR/75/M2904]SYZ70008.1 ras-like_small_GTPases [Leishmania braziliensis MHOM/BR/75/M2904]